jgi:hypothetical protein
MGVENLAGTLCLDSNTNRQAKVHKKQQLITPSLRSDKGTSLGFTVCEVRPSPPAPLPQRGRGEPRADLFGVLKR